jgi:uncharacterized membrane protein
MRYKAIDNGRSEPILTHFLRSFDMRSRARFLGHPVHPILITFPLGLLPIAVVFDLMAWISGAALWTDLAFYLIAAGTLGGLVAAVFGLIDWLAIPRGTRARAIGAWHGLGNLVVVSLFALSWTLRALYSPGPASRLLALVGLGLALVTGWLGGELVTRLGVGVDPGAHLNAPNSLSGEPADATARPRRPRS